MCQHRVKQDLLNSSKVSVSINKILVTKFVTVKVSQNLNLMRSLSTQWNQQLTGYVFSRVIEWLELNIRKHWLQKTIEYHTNELSTEYSNWNAENSSCRMFWNITR